MSNIHFEDNSVQIKDLIQSRAKSALYEIGVEIASQTTRNYDKAGRNKSGQTKGSYQSHVDDDTVTIGSNVENAIWEEFGTGIHAINGDGRKDVPWKYQDKKTGQWYSTSGKTGHRPFFTAFESVKSKIQKIVEDKFKDL